MNPFDRPFAAGKTAHSLRRFRSLKFLAAATLILAASTRSGFAQDAGAQSTPRWSSDIAASFAAWKADGISAFAAQSGAPLVATSRSAMTLRSPQTDFDAARLIAVRLTLRLQNSTVAELAWTTSDGKVGAHRFLLTGGASWRNATVSPTRAEGWSGRITSLALRLTSPERNRIELASLELLPTANQLPDALPLAANAPASTRTLLWNRENNRWTTRFRNLIPRARYRVSGGVTL